MGPAGFEPATFAILSFLVKATSFVGMSYYVETPYQLDHGPYHFFINFPRI